VHVGPTLTLVLLLLSVSLAAAEQLPPSSSGINGRLPEVEFSQLSQRDPNPLGEKALALHPEQWKHGETEHFIYHFVNSYVVTPISVEAEFHYRVVAKELERDQPAGDTKSHIYIFERPADWQQFQSVGRLEKWTGGIHSQGSLFILRDPAYKFSGNVLGHEISHLVLHRFIRMRFRRGWMKASRSMFPRAPTPVTSALAVTMPNPARRRSRRKI
jgi:hypothetical protein